MALVSLTTISGMRSDTRILPFMFWQESVAAGAMSV
jgi:hypothetical protein